MFAAKGVQQVGVIVAACDGLLEDRRVRRDSAQSMVIDELLQLTAGDEAAPDVIQPDRLPNRQRFPQLGGRLKLHDSAHARASMANIFFKRRSCRSSFVKFPFRNAATNSFASSTPMTRAPKTITFMSSCSTP